MQKNGCKRVSLVRNTLINFGTAQGIQNNLEGFIQKFDIDFCNFLIHSYNEYIQNS